MIHLLSITLRRVAILLLLCPAVMPLPAKAVIPDSLALTHLSAIAMAKDDTSRIRQLILYGKVLREHNLPDSAITILAAALSRSSQQNYLYGKLQAHYTIGLAYIDKADKVNSKEYIKKSIDLCTRRYAQWLPTFYNGYASTYLLSGDYYEAAQYYYKSIRIADSLQADPASIIHTYLNLHRLWHTVGEQKKSEEVLSKAEKIAVQNRDSTLLDDIYLMKGHFLLPSNAEKAKEYYQQAALIGNQTHDLKTAQDAYAGLASYYLSRKEMSKGKKYVAHYQTIATSLATTPADSIKLLLNYGMLIRMTEDFEEAEKSILKGLSLAKKVNIPLFIHGALEELSNLYAIQEKYHLAYSYQKKAEMLKDSLTTEERIKEMNLLAQKHELLQKDKKMILYELEDIKIKRQLAQRNSLLVFTCLLAVGLLVFYFFYRKAQKRKLQLQQERLKALEKEQETRKLQAIVDSEEMERKRIAMELHDGIGSMLSVTRFNLDAIKKKYTVTNDEDFQEALRLIDATVDDVRSTSHSLLPDMLLKGGLEEALKVLCTKLSKKSTINFQSYGSPTPLGADREKAIFRIVQLLTEISLNKDNPGNYLLQINWHAAILYLTIDLSHVLWQPQSILWEDIQTRVQAANGILEIDYPNNQHTSFNLEFMIHSSE